MPIAALLPLLPSIIAGIPGAIKTVKEFIDLLGSSKQITVAQQKALHDYVDSLQALALAGIKPEHWKVEADPE